MSSIIDEFHGIEPTIQKKDEYDFLKIYENKNLRKTKIEEYHDEDDELKLEKITYYDDITDTISRENDLPAVIIYHDYTDTIKTKIYYKNGILFRKNRNPVIEKYYEEEGIIKKEYFKSNNRQPYCIKYNKNHEIIGESFYLDLEECLLHRLNNLPAKIKYYNYNDKKIKGKSFYEYGTLITRNDKSHPSHISYYDNDENTLKRTLYKTDKNRIYIDYYENKKLKSMHYYLLLEAKSSRDENDKPANIEFYDNEFNTIKIQEYFINNRYTRENIKYPCYLEYYENGNIKTKVYYVNYAIERENPNKPAIIRYYENGRVKSIEYSMNGKQHRDNDKPAVIEFYDNNENSIRKIKFYQNGKLKRNNPEDATIIKIFDYLTEDIPMKERALYKLTNESGSLTYEQYLGEIPKLN